MLSFLASLANTQFLDDGSSWVFALPIGQRVYDGKRMRDLDEALATAVVANTNAAIASFDAIATFSNSRPFRFSIVRDHDMRGPAFGTLEEAKFANVDGKVGVWLRCSWTTEARADIEANRVKHVSIHVDEFVNQLGERFAPVAVELSLTSYPRIQSLGHIQETIGLRLSSLALAGTGAPMDPAAIAEIVANVIGPLIEQLNARLAQIEATLAAADQAPSADPAADPAPPADPAAAPAQMSQPAAAAAPAAPAAPQAPDASMQASMLAALESALTDKLKPITEKLEKFESLNLSQFSTPAGRFAMPAPGPSPEAVIEDPEAPAKAKWTAYEQLVKPNGAINNG